MNNTIEIDTAALEALNTLTAKLPTMMRLMSKHPWPMVLMPLWIFVTMLAFLMPFALFYLMVHQEHTR